MMRRPIWMLSVIAALLILALAACRAATPSTIATPVPTTAPPPAAAPSPASPSSATPTPLPTLANATPTNAAGSSVPTARATSATASIALKPQTVEGGGITVVVTPLELKKGEPVVFDIAMDTHSVDLAGDMLKIVVLRTDVGTEYAPSAWDGASPGGHHREGKIKFATLTGNPKSVTLVVRDLAGVPERKFKWDVPQ